VERGVGTATLRFSSAADVEPVWQRVLDGSLRNISVGYQVFRYEQGPDAATGRTVHRAVDWEPFEVSVVPVPLDRAATVRGGGGGGMCARSTHSDDVRNYGGGGRRGGLTLLPLHRGGTDP
jgi:hypothetical protein